MANREHLDMLKQGVDIWNQWRNEHLEIQPDLSRANLGNAKLSGANLKGADLRKARLLGANLTGADLSGTDLSGAFLQEVDLREAILRGAHLTITCFREGPNGVILIGAAAYTHGYYSRYDVTSASLYHANLSGATLSRADLSGANLCEAYLTGADLSEADLRRTNLSEAHLREVHLEKADLSELYLTGADFGGVNLREANLREANLSGADLSRTNLREANLSRAILISASLVETVLNASNLTECSIYGVSVWNVQLKDAIQSNLIITLPEEPMITVDNLAVAQFIYLLLNNENIRGVIDTITYKIVLILGRFTANRKMVLNTLRDELRKHDYLPVLFDFDRPFNRDFTETVRTLAHLSRFIIADLTDPSSIPQELQAIVPDLEIPVQPLLLEAKREYSMFVDFKKYHWVLPVYLYKDQASLKVALQTEIIEPAEKKTRELTIEKAKRSALVYDDAKLLPNTTV